MAHPADDPAGQLKWGRGGGDYARIPDWVLYRQGLSDRAKVLYGILSRHVNAEGKAFPGKPKLMKLLSCARSTLDDAMRELVKVGALTVTENYRKDGGRTANNYVLHWTETQEGPSDVPGVPPDQSREEQEELGVVPELGGKELAIARSLPAVPADPPLILIGPRPRENRPLNALVEECGIDPGNRQRMKWATAALYGDDHLQGIVHLYWLEVTRWLTDDAHPDRLELVSQALDRERYTISLTKAICVKAAAYRTEMDGARLTPTALRNWWLDLEKSRRSDEITAEQVGRMTDEELMNLGR